MIKFALIIVLYLIIGILIGGILLNFIGDPDSKEDQNVCIIIVTFWPMTLLVLPCWAFAKIIIFGCIKVSDLIRRFRYE